MTKIENSVRRPRPARKALALFAACAGLALFAASLRADGPAVAIRDAEPVQHARMIQIPVSLDNVPFVPGVVRQNGDSPAPHGPTCPDIVKTHTDSSFTGGSYIVEAGFAQQEMAAASYVIPATDFPVQLVMAEMIFATSNATQQTVTQWSIHFYDGTPQTGTEIASYASDDVVLPYLRIGPGTAGANAQFMIDSGDPEQVVWLNNSGTNTISFAYRIDQHNQQTSNPCISGPPTCCNAFPVVDVSGLSQSTNNWLFGVNCGSLGCPPNGGWSRFSNLNVLCRPTGDWVMRLTYKSLNCLPLPSVTSITPDHALNTGVQHVQITGQNLGTTGFSGVQLVKIDAPFPPPTITATNVAVTGGTLINADFNLTGATPGALWRAQVTTTGGTSTDDVFLNIEAPAPPQIIAFAPGTAPNNQILHATIDGDHLTGATSVQLQRIATGTPTINGTITSNSNTQIQANFDIHCIPAGAYRCMVTTPIAPTATYGTAQNPALNVDDSAPPPTVFGADQADTPNCPGSLPLTVFGNDFQVGATVFLVRSGQPDLAATSIDYGTPPDPTTLIATFNTAALLPGNYDLKVVNPDCKFVTSSPIDWQLAVTACVPTVSSVTPTSANNHQSAVALTINGGNFISGATVKLTRAGQPDINATGVTIVNAGQITCTVNIQLAQLGIWRVVVTNPGGAASVENVTFTVTAGPAPTVSLVTPANPTNCGVFNCTILGGNYAFATGVTAQLELPGQPNIVGTNVVRVSSTQLTASFNLTGVAITPTADKWDCRVTNPDGQNGLGVNKVNVVACSVSCTKGDINADTLRDGRDVSGFARVYLNPAGATATEQCAADIAAPAGVEPNDVPAFVNCLLTGACP